MRIDDGRAVADARGVGSSSRTEGTGWRYRLIWRTILGRSPRISPTLPLPAVFRSFGAGCGGRRTRRDRVPWSASTRSPRPTARPSGRCGLCLPSASDDGILGEEFGSLEGRSGLTWVLDPIDGNRAFLSGATTWGTLIGLDAGEGPILGLIDQPYTRERFMGGAGRAEMVRDGTRTVGDAALRRPRRRHPLRPPSPRSGQRTSAAASRRCATACA